MSLAHLLGHTETWEACPSRQSFTSPFTLQGWKPVMENQTDHRNSHTRQEKHFQWNRRQQHGGTTKCLIQKQFTFHDSYFDHGANSWRVCERLIVMRAKEKWRGRRTPTGVGLQRHRGQFVLCTHRECVEFCLATTASLAVLAATGIPVTDAGEQQWLEMRQLLLAGVIAARRRRKPRQKQADWSRRAFHRCSGDGGTRSAFHLMLRPSGNKKTRGWKQAQIRWSLVRKLVCGGKKAKIKQLLKIPVVTNKLKCHHLFIQSFIQTK